MRNRTLDKKNSGGGCKEIDKLIFDWKPQHYIIHKKNSDAKISDVWFLDTFDLISDKFRTKIWDTSMT